MKKTDKEAREVSVETSPMVPLECIPFPCLMCASDKRCRANTAFFSMLGKSRDWDPSHWTGLLEGDSKNLAEGLLRGAEVSGKEEVLLLHAQSGVVETSVSASRGPDGVLLIFLPGRETSAPSELELRINDKGVVLFHAGPLRRMLGLQPEKMTGLDFALLVQEEDRSAFLDHMAEARKNGESGPFTCRLRGPGGTPVWAEIRAAAPHDGAVGEILFTARDIGRRRAAEDRLRHLQDHFTTAIENMDAGIVMYDKDDRMVFCNHVYRNFYPRIAHLLVPGVAYETILHAFSKEVLARQLPIVDIAAFHAQRIRDRRERRSGRRVQHVGGGRWLQISDHPTGDGGVVTLLSDITGLKNAQEELSRQKLLLSSLLDAIEDLIFYKDDKGVYTACNPAFCHFAGRSREEIVGRSDPEVLGGENLAVMESWVARALEKRETVRGEEWMRGADGSRKRLELQLSPLFSPEGLLLGMAGVAHDVTARHNAEDLLQAESTRLSTLIRNIEGGVMVMDENKKVLLVNEGFLSLLRLEGESGSYVGIDAGDALRNILPLFANPRETYEKLASVFAARRVVRDCVVTLRDESFLEFDFIPMEIGRGTYNFLWHYRDITARRRAEMELQQRDRLLSGLAQTVRQLLGGMEDFDANMSEAFRIVAETASIERMAVYRNLPLGEGQTRHTAERVARWSRSPAPEPLIRELSVIAIDPLFTRWRHELSRGVILSGRLDEFPPNEQIPLRHFGFGSILVAPMFIGEHYWGIMIFDAAPDRTWSAADRGILRMVADSFGLAIQRKYAHDELSAALVRAEKLAVEAREASQAKTEFLASMSHEIRTPLNGVTGFSNLLRNTSLTPRQAELLRGIDRSTEMLLALINDILDLSKITAGQFTLDTIPFCPAMALEDAVAALGPRAVEKNLELKWEADSGAHQVFMGDERRLKQVLLNLVGNAIKFTEKGRVFARVSAGSVAASDGKTSVRLDFSVSDTGIGIAEENLSKLFLPFSQAQSDISRRFGGTGLGLAICRRLVNMMGGEIQVESVPGKGSTFSFHILCGPAEAPLEQVKAPSRTPESGGVLLPLSIVVADDNQINQQVLSMYIEEMGYHCEVVSDGAQALEAVKKAQVDLVLMDLRMPGMDGMEATLVIRKWEKDHLPEGRRPCRIVALTADAVKSDSEKCAAVGMDGYLTKPVDPDQIDRVIRQLFG